MGSRKMRIIANVKLVKMTMTVRQSTREIIFVLYVTLVWDFFVEVLFQDNGHRKNPIKSQYRLLHNYYECHFLL